MSVVNFEPEATFLFLSLKKQQVTEIRRQHLEELRKTTKYLSKQRLVNEGNSLIFFTVFEHS